MSGVKLTTVLEGVPRLLRAIELADPAVRDRTKAAIKRGTQAVAAGARQRAPKKSGELAYTVRDEYAKDGMVGFVKAGFGKLPRRSRSSKASRVQRLAKRRGMSADERALQFRLAPSSKHALAVKGDLGVYAPVVERGDPRRHKRPHAFMIPSLKQNQAGIVEDLKQASVAGAKHAGIGA